MAQDFKNEYMMVSQAVNAALLSDAVAGAWAGSMKGQAGVLVSAGPSLSKNAHVLADKVFLDRFVMVATAAAAGSPVWIARGGSMLTMFFQSGPEPVPVRGWATASASDKARYAAFFWGMIDRGVYLPCSQYEALFLSAALTDADIAATITAAHAVLAGDG